MSNNTNIIKILQEAAIQHRSSFGRKALENSCLIIKHLDFDIKDIKDLKGIKGIGKGSLRRIDEILKTGVLNENVSEKSEHLTELKLVYGIGDVFAKKLYDKGINTIDKLKKSNITLNSSQKIGLKYYKDFQLKIPRSEIKSLKKYFKTTMRNIATDVKFRIVGSYRRRKSESGDIDILLTGNNYLYEFISQLKEDNFLTGDLCWGDTKYMGVYENDDKVGRRIDIRFINYDYYYSALLHYTGSGDNNIKMRQKAISMGYSLNEYGLYKNKERININSEKDIFDILDMNYLKPEER